MFDIEQGQSTTGQVMKAQFELGVFSSPTKKILDASMMNRLNEAGEKMDVETLNKFHPEMSVPFDRPLTLEAANFLVKEDESYRKNKDIYDRGVNGFVSNLPGFVSNMAAQVIDPINLAVGVATGGFSTYLRGAQALSMAARVGITAGEAVASNAISESIIFSKSKELQQEYTTEQLITNLIAGSIMQVGLSHGADFASSIWGKFSPKTAAKLTQHFSDSAEMNIVPDMKTPIDNALMNLRISEDIAPIVDSHFGNAFLEDVSTVQELKHKIENSGDITVEQAREFYKDLDSSGGISKFVNEDEVISLDEKSVTTMKDRALDYKNDVRYDNEAVTHVDTTVKETDFSKFNEDKRTDLDEFLELHKTTEDSNIKNALTEVDEDIANESFLDAYRSCRGFK